jgi:lysozyme family protein
VTTDRLIDDLIAREGGFSDHAADRGGPTNYGITSRTLGRWRRLGRPARREEVQSLTEDEARAIYQQEYVGPFTAVPFDELRAQLIDIGVNTGVTTAIRLLQLVLGVPVDGILGERTRQAIAVLPWRLTNNALIAARVQHYAAIAEADASQRIFLRGWINRSVSFLVTNTMT